MAGRRTGDDVPPAPPEAEARYRALVAAALTYWRQWASDMAAGKPAPKPVDLLQVATLLELKPAGELLEADADAIRFDNRLHDSIDRNRAAHPRVFPDHPRQEIPA
jgi:hypothetical protein